MAKRILVTGGAGFIGSHIVDRFLDAGWLVRVLDCLQSRVHPEGTPQHLHKEVEVIRGDIRNRADWERALEGVSIVSHQAAYQDYVPDYSEFMSINAAGTAMLFEVIAAKHLPIERVVVASSQACYGEGQYSCSEHGIVLPRPRKLADLARGDWDVRCPTCAAVVQPAMLDEAYPNPLSPYGVSKYAQELTALRLANLLEIPCVALRYSITQGPRQSMFNQYSGIARIFTLKLLHDEAPIAFEDGLLRRDYVHVSDVVEANWIVTEDDRAVGEVFNVGTGQPTTVAEYATCLARVLGKSIEPTVPGIFRTGDARHSVSSIAKLRKLGWEPKKGLTDILVDFTSWARSRGNTDRFLTDAHEQLLKMKVLRMSS